MDFKIDENDYRKKGPQISRFDRLKMKLLGTKLELNIESCLGKWE